MLTMWDQETEEVLREQPQDLYFSTENKVAERCEQCEQGSEPDHFCCKKPLLLTSLHFTSRPSKYGGKSVTGRGDLSSN